MASYATGHEEIANGRLAMMAIIGMFFQNGLTGSLVTNNMILHVWKPQSRLGV